MNQKKRIASLSLDLDNKWSYMKTHGEVGWEEFPSYLDVLVPRVLDFLEERDLKITFFVVGQDAALAKNYEALKMIAAAGHEIGNHSFHHEPWLHLYTEQQIKDELAQAEEHIEIVTGQKPIGFRGPGFSLSDTTLEVLSQRGYLYDASTFPTLIGPLARAYYLMTANLPPEEKEKRRRLFGTFSDGLRPNKPYHWQLRTGGIIEVPVTTMPILRLPIHVSYILFLSTFSRMLALTYFKSALTLCKLMDVQPSLLLHPLDFLGCNDFEELSFFPAMKVPYESKLEVVSKILDLFKVKFTVLTVQQHALASLPTLVPA